MQDPLEELEQALELLGATSWAGPELAQALVRVSRCRNRLEAHWLELVARFDTTREWEADGAVSAGAWLADRCKMRPSPARADVRLARRLRDMPATVAALSEGAISGEHARALATGLRTDQFGDAEATLVEAARSARPDDTRRLVTEWRTLMGDDAALDHHDRRYLHVSNTFEGAVAVDGMLEPAGGAIVGRALQHLADQQDSDATRAQQRADALVELSARYLRGALGSPMNPRSWWSRSTSRPSPGARTDRPVRG